MQNSIPADKELVKILKAAPNQGADWSGISVADIPEQRAQDPKARATPTITEGVEFELRQIPGLPGEPDVQIGIFRPANVHNELPAMLWMHGGGHISGTVAADSARLCRMVLATQCAIVAVEYRLSPEHPYPAALHDCYASLLWADRHGAELQIDSSRLGIAGGSAGAGLAAGLCLLARDRAEVVPIFQLLVYPMIDDRCTTTSSHLETMVWPRENNLLAWQAYLGYEPGGKDVPFYAAPARAEDLRGLPSSFVCVGTHDLFRDEDITYAQRLLSSDVQTELHVYAGATHGFIGYGAAATIAKRCQRDINDFICTMTAHP